MGERMTRERDKVADEEVNARSVEEKNSLVASSVSIDSLAPMVIEETEKDDFEDDVCKQAEKNESQGAVRSSPQSLVIAKLYNENVELGETLVATQSELGKVRR